MAIPTLVPFELQALSTYFIHKSKVGAYTDTTSLGAFFGVSCGLLFNTFDNKFDHYLSFNG